MKHIVKVAAIAVMSMLLLVNWGGIKKPKIKVKKPVICKDDKGVKEQGDKVNLNVFESYKKITQANLHTATALEETDKAKEIDVQLKDLEKKESKDFAVSIDKIEKDCDDLQKSLDAAAKKADKLTDTAKKDLTTARQFLFEGMIFMNLAGYYGKSIPEKATAAIKADATCSKSLQPLAKTSEGVGKLTKRTATLFDNLNKVAGKAGIPAIPTEKQSEIKKNIIGDTKVPDDF